MTSVPRRRGLGRGLEALLANTEAELDEGGPDRPGSALIEVDPNRVGPNPEQPRRHFDEQGLTSLAESIRLHGLLHPIVVERDGDQHRLVAGERRLRAAQRAGVSTIPAIVRPAAESGRHALELALTENLMREGLNPMEEAAAYARLADAFGLSHEAIALRLGRSRPAVSNAIRLLQLPAPVQEAVSQGHLGAGHARALLGLRDDATAQRLADRIRADGLSVRATEQAVQRDIDNREPRAPQPRAPEPRLSPDDEHLRRGFEQSLGLPVQLQRRRRGGRLVIDFPDDDDLDQLYRHLGGPPL